MWRKAVKALLVPAALVVLVVGTALPAAASSPNSGKDSLSSGSTTLQSTLPFKAKPNSLNW
jgi:hypothetical protein